ncbi:MAG: flagellar biosynthesis regulator FlaF [Parvularculaceae bacterium]
MQKASPAQGVYRHAMRATASPRAIEAGAIADATRDLKSGIAGRERDFPAYIAALSRNLGLWTHLAADIIHLDNKLPNELRTQLLRLAAFVRSHTLRLQRQDVAADPNVLIEINQNIIAGLQAAPAAGTRS